MFPHRTEEQDIADYGTPPQTTWANWDCFFSAVLGAYMASNGAPTSPSEADIRAGVAIMNKVNPDEPIGSCYRAWRHRLFDLIESGHDYTPARPLENTVLMFAEHEKTNMDIASGTVSAVALAAINHCIAFSHQLAEGVLRTGSVRDMLLYGGTMRRGDVDHFLTGATHHDTIVALTTACFTDWAMGTWSARDLPLPPLVERMVVMGPELDAPALDRAVERGRKMGA